MTSSPNILLITTDQQHYRALGVLSSKLKTPNLDRLAAMGTRFHRAYCPNPTCTPTRASIITGMYPSAHGAYTLGTKLSEQVPTVGQYLHAAGYRTSLIGKAHFQPLKDTPEGPSYESHSACRDLEFWKTFNATHTPWYGFDHVELARNHTDEGHVGQHYALWMEENGLKNWRAYFQVRHDGVRETAHDDTLTCPRTGPGHDYGWRGDMHWKLPEEFHYTRWTGLRTIAMIEESVKAGQPFFCWSSYHDPHPPYALSEPWASMYNPDDMDSEIGHFVEGEFDHMPPIYAMTRDPKANFASFHSDRVSHGVHCHNVVDRAEMRRAIANYYGMISFIDHWVGKTLDTLERLNQLDNTLIVFSTDHGHFLGQHGLIAKGPFHYEDVIRVPFIAAMPGKIAAGAVNQSIHSLVDLAPTFLEVAGLPTPLQMQGKSQWTHWQKNTSARTHAIIENHHNAAAVHLRTVVNERYKITMWRGRDWGELFDLQDDPNELHNRYNDPSIRSSKRKNAAGIHPSRPGKRTRADDEGVGSVRGNDEVRMMNDETDY